MPYILKWGFREKKWHEMKPHGLLGYIKNSQETFSLAGVLGQSAPFSHGTGSHTSPTKKWRDINRK